MEEVCIGGQSKQWTEIAEKLKNVIAISEMD
jgi:hypothetical protein